MPNCQPTAQHRLAGDAAGAACNLGAMSGCSSRQASRGSREAASGAPEGWRWAASSTLKAADEPKGGILNNIYQLTLLLLMVVQVYRKYLRCQLRHLDIDDLSVAPLSFLVVCESNIWPM